jgi:hypothetical protein
MMNEKAKESRREASAVVNAKISKYRKDVKRNKGKDDKK